MKKLILSILFIFLILSSFGQDFNKTKRTLKADEVYETNELLKALDLYKAAYSKAESKPEKAYIRFQMGEIYRKTLKYKKAAMRYKSAIQKGYKDPKAIFYYAKMLQATMKYDEALVQFKLFLEKSPNDSLAQLGYRSCVASEKWIKNPTRYEIANLKKLNSRNGDFAATYGNELGTEVVFTTARKRPGFSKVSKVTGQYYTSIFEIYQNRAGQWEDLAPLNDTINSRYDDGSPSFSSDYTSMYFTRCKTIKGEYLGCNIFEAKRQPGEFFTSAKYLPIAADSISVGQPSISKDGLTLYFASDMPGGMGGKDIWKVERESVGADFGEPINMGSDINTPGNELYPYIRDNGMLYFSSDYHPGMGELDIFRAIPKGDAWSIYNLKYPINSSADDFSIAFKKGEKEVGMFSSSRKITELKDEKGRELIIKSRGGDDIYSFELPEMEFSLTGIIADINTDLYINQADVEVYGDDGSEMVLKTGEEGRFKYKLKKDVEYVYLIRKEGYLNAKGQVSTMDLDDSQFFKQEIKMTPIGAPIALDNIFYDFGKWTLTDSSKIELNKLVQILEDNPNITIELGAHTDKIGDEASNKVLSQRRAQSVVDFLVSKHINRDRLSAMGYGESKPQTINYKLSQQSSFSEGSRLDEAFIEALKNEKGEVDKERQEEANQINRRTEFKVLSTRYIPDIADVN